MLRRFLFDQLYADEGLTSDNVDVNDLPEYSGRIHIHHSASSLYYAPSDLAGPHGMHREHIRSTPLWNKKYERRDTVLVQVGSEDDIMGGMMVGQVLRFLAIVHDEVRYPCALVQWFAPLEDTRDDVTGMWKVRPEKVDHKRVMDLVHIDTIARGCHLMPYFGEEFLPRSFEFTESLSAFNTYFLNRSSDFHFFECII
jgi:hypothetical protein